MTSFTLQAQHEVGVKLHTLNFMGDFGGGGGMGTVFLKDVNVQATTMGFSFEHKRHFTKVLSWKSSIGAFSIHSNDQYTRNPFRRERDLSMKGSLMELTTGLEVDIFPMSYCVKRSSVTPYFGISVGAAVSNIDILQNMYNAEKLELEQEYLTERTRQVAPVFPIYLGIKAKVGPNWVFSSELNYRQTIGDNLDGYVRQQDDTYFSASVGVAYNICGPSLSPIRCPRF
ncbi:MAG TPA: hypothetical protein DCF84_00620 [Bacteroidetes bacterium]|nr:hypothetical protein [Bacteroidota bacterium]|tara:strand:- start:260 stop:943 length:684 start_codon:yes stop_codon:yes gene_type:complete